MKFRNALGVDQGVKEDQASGAVDLSTRLAQERTDLALQRTFLANERTLESWVRTAISMISFGFTLGKLVQAEGMNQVQGVFGIHTWSIREIAYFLVAIGLVALLGATFQHAATMRDLVKMGFRRRLSIAFVVALLVVAVGLFALTSLVLKV